MNFFLLYDKLIANFEKQQTTDDWKSRTKLTPSHKAYLNTKEYFTQSRLQYNVYTYNDNGNVVRCDNVCTKCFSPFNN